jgi:LmbE family N-acetylglucosaminyl deacetylase
MNILFVGAHHDDLEVSIGGSIKRWTQEGHKAYSAILTNSSWTAPDGTSFRNSEPIEDYCQRAAKLLGYSQISLGFSNCFELRYTDDKVAALLDIMERHSVDTLITITPNDAHPDHRMAAEIALNSARRMKRILLTRVSWNSYPGGFNPTYFVDISDVIEVKREALRCYEDEYRRTGTLWDRFVDASATLYGLEAGCDFAEGFEIVKFCE